LLPRSGEKRAGRENNLKISITTSSEMPYVHACRVRDEKGKRSEKKRERDRARDRERMSK